MSFGEQVIKIVRREETKRQIISNNFLMSLLFFIYYWLEFYKVSLQIIIYSQTNRLILTIVSYMQRKFLLPTCSLLNKLKPNKNIINSSNSVEHSNVSHRNPFKAFF